METELSAAQKDPAASWLREAIVTSLGELRLYVSTLEFAWRPRRFVEQWLSGERRPMNPLGFMATSLAGATVIAQITSIVVVPAHAAETRSVIGDLLRAVGPYVYYVALGLLCHGLLAALGSRKSLFGSIAIALYAGGAATLQAAVMLNAEVIWAAAQHLTLEQAMQTSKGAAAFFLTLALSLLIYAVPLGRGLSILHGVSRRRCATAFVLAFVGTGFVFGTFHPPGDYGLHLELAVTRHSVSCNLSMND